ncbi:hypothetical protein [Candidatus Neptunochlamydia vexilliferae]|uniref:Cell division protein FtsL n=1 Tax=Candidatus Neptunichlamydia vexilliferae TaxID=1651774 RepID=A0ABS0AYM1_9BACT|nr:hypothetical protein [Candidatus Neptunochlamydia vexilliferae]MBF5059234.1 hypothetical protein [Candidatus Neptunochlamydia vexilliferae]
MDWTQSFAIICIFAAFFIYLIAKLEKLSERVSSVETRLSVMENELKNNNQRLSSIEGYLVPKKVFKFEDREAK